jgi:hypothetical protein
MPKIELVKLHVQASTKKEKLFNLWSNNISKLRKDRYDRTLTIEERNKVIKENDALWEKISALRRQMYYLMLDIRAIENNN